MSRTAEADQRLRVLRKKLGLNLVLSWIVPLVLAVVLSRLSGNDTIALAVAGAVPAVRVLAGWAWRRRVDWISVMPFVGFMVALAVTALSGGASLPLKLYRPVGTGVIGLALLISVAVGRPLLLPVIRFLASRNPETSGRVGRPWETPAGRRKFTILTAVIGLVALGDAVAHVIMALTLPTVTFLIMSRVITVVEIAILLAIRWITGRRAGRT